MRLIVPGVVQSLFSYGYARLDQRIPLAAGSTVNR